MRTHGLPTEMKNPSEDVNKDTNFKREKKAHIKHTKATCRGITFLFLVI